MRDENIFLEPDIFNPERWLSEEHNGSWTAHNRLDKHLVAFGKGARMCQGIKYVPLSYFLLRVSCLYTDRGPSAWLTLNST